MHPWKKRKTRGLKEQSFWVSEGHKGKGCNPGLNVVRSFSLKKDSGLPSCSRMKTLLRRIRFSLQFQYRTKVTYYVLSCMKSIHGRYIMYMCNAGVVHNIVDGLACCFANNLIIICRESYHNRKERCAVHPTETEKGR